MGKKIDLSKAPYLDRFSKDKNYEQVLYNPDRMVQSAELNEQQSILHHKIADVGNAIFKDGDRQNGAEIHFTAVKDGDNYTYEGEISKGLVYLSGAIREVPKTPFKFTGKGRAHYIGVSLNQEIVTAKEDEALLGQASGTPSAFSEGADRLKSTVSITFDDANSAVLYEFDALDLKTKAPDNTMSQINKVLAERTYDESGSYKVTGLTTWTDTLKEDINEFDEVGNLVRTRTASDSLQWVIDSGKAYVLGFQIFKPTGSRVCIDKALNTQSISNEGSYYSDTVRKQTVANTGVKSVDNVTGQVRITKEVVARGTTPNGSDFLGKQNVTKIEKVWTDTQEFEEGKDFRLLNGQAVSWEPVTGEEPSTGSSYYITYIYSKTLEKGKDYQVTTDGEEENKVWYIDFNGMTGDKPVDQTLVYVSYTFYLARVDLLTLDAEGNFSIKQGQPNVLRNVLPPNHLDPTTLRIATVLIYPNSNKTLCSDVSVQRMDMESLRKMSNRVDNLEYNEAVNALDKGAMEKENPVYLRGVFSDGFISMDKYDATHPDATIAFSFEDAEITLPYQEVNKVSPSILENQSEAHVWGRLVTAPFTEEVALSQPLATTPMNVNPYNVYNKLGVLTVEPSSDNWIDEERITVTDTVTTAKSIRLWYNHGNEPWVAEERAKYGNIVVDGQNGQTLNDLSGRWGNNMQGTTLTSGGQRTKESMIEYIRSREITFTATNLTPNEDNLSLAFDSIPCSIKPAEGFSKGSTLGTIRANSSGIAKGTFVIPEGVRCGTREVTLQSPTALASTSYTAQGTLKTTEDVIIRTRITINLYDPLAQSFQFTTARISTGINLYFASKSSTENCIVQVRGISEGGQPNKKVYAETVLTPDKINISDDGKKATTVRFDDPLMLSAGEEYCIVIITDSPDYTMWVATMGQSLVDNPTQTVVSNPYLQGVLYSSSNASAWTVHQNSDLKFDILTANFNSSALLEFDTMENLGVDRVVLMSTYLTPNNTGCTWEMKIVLDNEPTNITVADKKWEPIGNYSDLDVEQIAREVKLRATFDANRFMSPLLSTEDIMFAGFLTALKGSYISRAIDLSSAPYNKIKLQYNEFTPTGTKVTPRWSDDGGVTWKNFTSTPKVTPVGTGFNTIAFDETVALGTDTKKSFKVRLDLTTQNAFKRPRVQRLMSTMKNE